MRRLINPLQNKKAFGELESDSAKMAFTIGVTVILLALFVTLFSIFKNGSGTVATVNSKQIENTNNSIKNH